MNTSRTVLLRAPIAAAFLILLAHSPRLRAADTEENIIAAAQELDSTARKAGDAKVITRLTDDFAALSGSKENSAALIQGLRDGTAVKLTSTTNGQTQTTSFTPATGKLGYGNVYLALALAQADLTKAGIAKPTPDQLQAALVGGKVTVGDKSVALTGVLALRASGQGWGQIARTLDVRLGEAVSGLRSARGQLERGDRPEKPDKPEKPATPDRAARPETPVRPDRAARPEMPERAPRPERAGR